MIQEVFPNLYKSEIPLPNSPLIAINSYVIKAQGRVLIIDTGMNRKECHEAMLSTIKELGVDLRKADFFITHVHTDHVGLVAELASEESKIYFNRPEATRLDFQQIWERARELYLLNAFPDEEIKRAMASHPGSKYHVKKHINPTILDEGDIIEIGDYRFRCISTPGHSRGHMCLYEADKKLFVSGDHVLQDVTPNISLSSWSTNPLKDYMASLDKVYDTEASLVLPGHGRVFTDLKKRITELKEHHRERLNEVLAIVDGGTKNAYKIASEMKWDIEYRSWEEFPAGQKWFAMGEALSHLKYLDEEGSVRSSKQNNEIVFSLT